MCPTFYLMPYLSEKHGRRSRKQRKRKTLKPGRRQNFRLRSKDRAPQDSLLTCLWDLVSEMLCIPASVSLSVFWAQNYICRAFKTGLARSLPHLCHLANEESYSPLIRCSSSKAHTSKQDADRKSHWNPWESTRAYSINISLCNPSSSFMEPGDLAMRVWESLLAQEQLSHFSRGFKNLNITLLVCYYLPWTPNV